MRGQSKKQMSLEESCRAGACPRRLFLVCAGNFAACGRRGTFPAMGKHPKDRRGTPQRRTSFANDGLPPVPHYGGRVPESRQKISGAQNLSGFPQFNPAHWGLVLRLALPSRWRLVLGRRARPPGRAAFGWLKKCRRGDTPGRPAPMGSAGGPRASPTQFRKTFLKPVGEGLAPPDVPRYGGPVWDRPLQKDRNASTFSVGAGVLTRPLLRGSPFVGCGLPDAPSLRKSRNGTGYAVRLSRA